MPRRSRILILLLISLLLLVSTVQAQARSSVLFDQGHGQRFLIERGGDLDLSLLAGTFRNFGHAVLTSSAPLSERILDGIDVLLISGPFRPYTPGEIEAVQQFLERGGAVCITIHVAPPLSDLLFRLGVDHSNGVIHEVEGTIDDDPLNFRVTRLEKHPLFQGIRQISLHGGWALLDTRNGLQSVARTSPGAWINPGGNGRIVRQSFAVAVAGEVGKGRFIVFGDDAILQNKFLKEDNLTLARNLAAWLTGGRQAPPLAIPSR